MGKRFGLEASLVPTLALGVVAMACSSGNNSGGNFGSGQGSGDSAMGASGNLSGAGTSSGTNGSSGSSSSSGTSSAGLSSSGASSSGAVGGGVDDDAAASGSTVASSGPPMAADAGQSGTPGSSWVNDAGNSKPPVDSGASTASSGDGGALDALRQVCVDQINMYRATLKLAPLKAATAADDACSDMGAMHDATTMMPHSSSGFCPGFPGYQDTCPELPVGGFTGATLQSSLLQCLAQMWAEGPPPGTIASCEADITGCFEQHGHYINMSNPQLKTVSCGFYQVSSTDWWGNQNFALQ